MKRHMFPLTDTESPAASMLLKKCNITLQFVEASASGLSRCLKVTVDQANKCKNKLERIPSKTFGNVLFALMCLVSYKLPFTVD